MLVTGHREIKFFLTCKIPPCWLTFILKQNSPQVLVEESLYQQSHPDVNAESYNNGQTSKLYHEYNSGMNAVGITNYFLTGSEAFHEEKIIHTWHCKYDQEDMTRELLGSKGEPATIKLNRIASNCLLNKYAYTHRLVKL